MSRRRQDQAEAPPTGMRRLWREERGVTLVLASLLLVVLMGAAAFAIDLGWLYFQTTNARKAAESAALAGVVYMPEPGAWGSGAQAWDTAVDVAARAGYDASDPSTTVTPKQVAGEQHQLEVDITTTVPTFFMRVFGISDVTFTRSATAEALPPLRLGSDDEFLGNDPDLGRWRGFWLAVNGDAMAKGQGDPYSTKCTGADADNHCPSSSSGAPYNDDFKRPSYYYAFEVPDSTAGDSVSFQVYDPQLNANGKADDRDDDNPSDYATHSNSNVMDVTFRIYAPDATPADPTDNDSLVCQGTYRHQGSSGYSSSLRDHWVSICSTNATRGIYVMTVSVTGWSGDLNSFALRALVNGSPSNDVAVFGMGAMSIWNTGGGWQPGGNVATFDLVELLPAYAGEQIVVGLWDVGDLDRSGSISFGGSVAPYDCQYRVIPEGSSATPWMNDDGASGANQCRIDIGVQEFNNEWVEVRFDIPDSHTCTGSACFATVQYNFGTAAHDRTTWSVRVNGQPIHLLP